jgi:hypothetical protein
MLRPLLACVFVMALLPLSVTRAAPGRPGIVLVHGAFADGSSWSRVIPLLQRQGYNVTVAQLPLTSLADDVAATRRAMRKPSRASCTCPRWFPTAANLRKGCWNVSMHRWTG